MNIQISATRREALIWGTLAVDVLVALYYFGSIAAQGLGGELSEPALVGLVVRTVVLAIVASVVIFGAIHALTRAEPMDERDYRFQARANTVGYYVLAVGVVAVIGHIIMHSVAGNIGAPTIFRTSPATVVHLLIVVLVASSVLRAAVQLFHYRRGG
ncbi:hypothetical protein [Marinimicrobium sp. ABcell2]|uniref:hypothetical protein n=1 Tax=Marinimicrobium sp. ABcell2 TaxID=3069751 RepID=UPI0027B5355B|nr:hypothetical protein [Marinimicrobium sp. ABcell2]MDQ2076093.1 hypothetical protein [Marinimicrobium sp. ABcell2]